MVLQDTAGGVIIGFGNDALTPKPFLTPQPLSDVDFVVSTDVK